MKICGREARIQGLLRLSRQQLLALFPRAIDLLVDRLVLRPRLLYLNVDWVVIEAQNKLIL